MASLFTGTPQTATSYTTSSTETPKWLQDAIYNQIQVATGIANRDYQPYNLPRVADAQPMQSLAYEKAGNNYGFFQSDLDAAQKGVQGLGTAGTAGDFRTAQDAYLRPRSIDTLTDAGTGALSTAAGINALNTASPYFSKAFDASSSLGTYAAPYLKTAGQADLLAQASPYLKSAGDINIQTAGQPMFDKAAGYDIAGAANPYFKSAADMRGSAAANPYLNSASVATEQGMSGSSLGAAVPFLMQAGRSTADAVSGYMNPYTDAVTSRIAQLGARNLKENLLPAVSDQFIRAGQFGSGRMGEFGSRALRDTQESVLGQQSQALQQGYGQALGAAQQDLARQGQLASTVGQLSSADYARALQAAGQYQSLGQTAGQLTNQEAAQLANLGQAQGQLTAQQVSALTGLGQARGAAAGQQAGNLSSVGQALGALTGQQGNLYSNLAQNVANIYGQQGSQLANLGSTAGQLDAQRMSALGSLGGTYLGAGQAQQQYGLNAAQGAQAAQAADYQRQLAAYSQLGALQQMEQQMRTADVGALEAAGQAQQAQKQRELDAAYQQFIEQRAYPQSQMDWLSTQVRGMAPITPTSTTQSGQTTGASYSASPLSQLAAGLYTYKGLNSI